MIIAPRYIIPPVQITYKEDRNSRILSIDSQDFLFFTKVSTSYDDAGGLPVVSLNKYHYLRVSPSIERIDS